MLAPTTGSPAFVHLLRLGSPLLSSLLVARSRLAHRTAYATAALEHGYTTARCADAAKLLILLLPAPPFTQQFYTLVCSQTNKPSRNGTQVAQALRARLPQAAASLGGASGSSSSAVVHHNGALPATGPAFFEHCVDNQLRLQQHSHRVAGRLVLIEFGVNTDGQPAAFERLLRKLLMLRPAVAILVVNTHVWTLKGHYRTCWKGVRASKVSMSEPEQRAEQTWEDRFNYGDEDAISRLCTHYGVPLVSMRSALLDAVRTDASPSTRLSHFMIDCKHPSGQGHTYLCLLYTSPSPRDRQKSRMPSSA